MSAQTQANVLVVNGTLRLSQVEVHLVRFLKTDRVKRHKLIFAVWPQFKFEFGLRSGKVRQRVGRKTLLPPYQNRRAVNQSNTFGMLLVNGRVEKFHGEFNRDSVARVPLSSETRPTSGATGNVLPLTVHAQESSPAPTRNTDTEGELSCVGVADRNA